MAKYAERKWGRRCRHGRHELEHEHEQRLVWPPTIIDDEQREAREEALEEENNGGDADASHCLSDV